MHHLQALAILRKKAFAFGMWRILLTVPVSKRQELPDMCYSHVAEAIADEGRDNPVTSWQHLCKETSSSVANAIPSGLDGALQPL